MATKENADHLLLLLGVRANEPKFQEYLKSYRKVPGLEQDESDDSFFLGLHDDGISFLFDKDLYLDAIHIYSGRERSEDGYGSFLRPLPNKLSFDLKRKEVREILGEPSVSGGGGKNVLNKITPQWDRYDWDAKSLHVQYSDVDGRVSLVTLMRTTRNEKGEVVF